MIAAILLAAACVCPPAAARKTDARIAAKERQKLRAELDAIPVQARAAFERGER